MESNINFDVKAKGRDPRVSVCIATYNGDDFVEEQLRSILVQLRPTDEVILVDDGSGDDTLRVVRELGDERIVTLEQENGGHVRAFETALEKATGDVVLLSDQDDVWPAGRVSAMVDALQRGSLVAGALQTFGGPRDGHRLAFPPSVDGGFPHWFASFSLGRLPYFGSAMGMTREIRDLCLPIPAYVEAHDHWIALVGRQTGQVVHLTDVVTLRREHETNLSPVSRRGLIPVLKTRVIMLRMLAQSASRARLRGHGSHPSADAR